MQVSLRVCELKYMYVFVQKLLCSSSELVDGDSKPVFSTQSTSPVLLPLTQACRCQLRRHLLVYSALKPGGLFAAVNALPLPTTLQRFLLLDELDHVH